VEPRESLAGAFTRRTVTSRGRTLDLLAAPAGPGGALLVTPAVPALDRDPAGRPVLTLTLVLERTPGAGEAIAPLVRHGLVGLTLSLAVPPWALAALREGGEEPRPLFARAARFEVGPAGGAPLAAADGAGAGPRAALSAVLDGESARRALAALRGEASGLEARASVTFRPPAAPPPQEEVPGIPPPVEEGPGVRSARDAGGLATVEVSAKLEALLAGEALDLDRHVRLVAPRAPGEPPEEVPARQAGAAPRAGPGGAGSPSLAAVGGRITSLGMALHPGGIAHAAPAQALAAAQLGRIGAAVLDDAVVATDVRSLPVVQDPAAALWPDRLDPRRRWYAPALELVRPTGAEDPSASPFLFRWKQVGVTAGPEAAPGLEGAAVFTLRTTMPAAVREALRSAGDPPATPVPLSGLSVAVEVPFREQGTGATRTQIFPARVEGGTSINSTPWSCSRCVAPVKRVQSA